MDKLKDTYECEECGGVFIITPEFNETITYCPQCGDCTFFSKLIVQNDKEDE